MSVINEGLKFALSQQPSYNKLPPYIPGVLLNYPSLRPRTTGLHFLRVHLISCCQSFLGFFSKEKKEALAQFHMDYEFPYYLEPKISQLHRTIEKAVNILKIFSRICFRISDGIPIMQL
jgi:hypothetical protein